MFVRSVCVAAWSSVDLTVIGPNAATARASRRILARHKLILTGTPVQNRVNELWAAFDFLMPNFLGSLTSFSKEFAKPIANSQDPGASAVSISVGLDKLKVLHQQVLPFILRREKEQVLKELPPKNITVIKVPMSDIQSKIYDDFCAGSEVQKSLAVLQRAVQDEGAGDDVGGKGSDLCLGSDVFKSLLFLRLLCTHPHLVKTNSEMDQADIDTCYSLGASGKLLALAELLRDAGIYNDEITAADNDSSLLYCDIDTEDTDPYGALLDPDDGSGPGTGGGPNVKDQSKCLIFAQFTQSLDVVEDFLIKPHMPSLRYLRLDGRVPVHKRTELVNSFNRDPSIKVMLLTTRAGGLGLNLTGKPPFVWRENVHVCL
jgi:TATA-binding protein-associated factor